MYNINTQVQKYFGTRKRTNKKYFRYKKFNINIAIASLL